MKRLAAVLLLALLAAPAAAQEPDLRLYAFDCGRFDDVPAEPFLPGAARKGEKLSLVDRCYLVRHPHGDLLWDTGLPDEMASRSARFVLWLRGLFGPNVHLDRTLADQLAELDVHPSDIEYLALSHRHFDHAGNANAFAGSVWLVQAAERAAAFGPGPRIPYDEPELYADLADAETVELHGDRDVFGDGRVVILSAPGHTEGHQCLFVDLARTGPVILSGDLYHTRRNRELRVVPSFNVDREQTLASMDRIEAFAAEHGARILIQHDPVSNQDVPLSPAYLD